jgi:hypothetical protein
MSEATQKVPVRPSTRSALKVGLLTVPLLVAAWRFLQAIPGFLDLPTARWSLVIVGIAMLIAIGRLVFNRLLYEEIQQNDLGRNILVRFLPETWAIVSLALSIGSFTQPMLGLAALGAAIAALGSEFFKSEGRMRPLLWFVCFSFPILFLTSWWQHVTQYATHLIASIASTLLDSAAVPHLLENTAIDIGNKIPFEIASVFALWNSLETYLAVGLAACLILRSSFVSLGFTLVLAFYWCIGILACHAALDIFELEGTPQVLGMSLPVASSVLSVLGLAGVVLLQQFVSTLCGPIFFNTLDTPLPMIPQGLNRILNFPEPVHQLIQPTTTRVRSDSEESEYEEISLSALSATTKSTDDSQVGVVRFEEVLQRNKRAEEIEREQA